MITICFSHVHVVSHAQRKSYAVVVVVFVVIIIIRLWQHIHFFLGIHREFIRGLLLYRLGRKVEHMIYVGTVSLAIAWMLVLV